MADTYTVEREIRVDAPASVVYERIVDFYRSLALAGYSPRRAGAARGFGSMPTDREGPTSPWSPQLVVSLPGAAATVAWIVPTLIGLPLVERRVSHIKEDLASVRRIP